MFGMVALFAGVLGISAFMVTDMTSDNPADEGETDPPQDNGDVIDIDVATGSAENAAQSEGDRETVDAAVAEPAAPDDNSPDDEAGGDPLIFTAAGIAASPAPLEDFALVDDFTEVTAGDGDTVGFTMPEDSGTLYVLPADYVESTRTEDGDETYVYSGYNVYYVPADQSFPQDYQWSEDGATLYNGETYAQDAQDFRDVRLVARIDSGNIATDTAYEDGTETVFDNRLGAPRITANCAVIWGA